VFSSHLTDKFRSLPTPFYYYDINLLEETLNRLQKEALPHQFKVHYALKANSNPVLLKIIYTHGLGADCVSGNEIKRAIDCGFSPKHIVFAGVGKTDEEIKYALNNNIFSLNCESLQEIPVIDQIAKSLNKAADIALRINPNVNANTHKHITTGLEENKFGINLWELDEVIAIIKGSKNINLTGLHFHIGSQITDLSSFKNLCIRVNEIQRWAFDQQLSIKHLNMGGGLGIDYQDPDKHLIPDFNNFFNLFKEFLEVQQGQSVHFELGRSIIGQCGSLISKVLFLKKGSSTDFVILDAGMTDLMRPALYQAYHKIENLSSKKGKKKYDIVGPVCESTDCFGKAITLAETQRGDLIVIRSAGAYGEAMASSYNLRDIPKNYYSHTLAEKKQQINQF
jgi:diaminopimelate decarboxylase